MMALAVLLALYFGMLVAMFCWRLKIASVFIQLIGIETIWMAVQVLDPSAKAFGLFLGIAILAMGATMLLLLIKIKD